MRVAHLIFSLGLHNLRLSNLMCVMLVGPMLTAADWLFRILQRNRVSNHLENVAVMWYACSKLRSSCCIDLCLQKCLFILWCKRPHKIQDMSEYRLIIDNCTSLMRNNSKCLLDFGDRKWKNKSECSIIIEETL